MGYSVLSKYRAELMGMAMLWVMLFHAWDLDLGPPVFSWLRSTGFGGVDIFVLLSAMGLALSLSRREQSYTDFMARRAGRVLPAYLAVMLPYTAWKVISGAAPLSSLFWNASLLYYWVRNSGAFNWYIAGIMTLYALTPMCFRFLRSKKRRRAWTGAGIVLGLLLCQMLMQDGYWGYVDVFFRLPIFFLGLLMGFFVKEDRRLSRRDALFWCVWFALGCVYVPLSVRFDERLLYLPLCHLFLFSTVPVCLAVCLLFEKLPLGWPRRLLRLVGENSLEIYLLNVSVFSETEALHRLIPSGPSNRLFYLIVFSANICFGVLLHMAVGRLRTRRAAAPAARNAGKEGA